MSEFWELIKNFERIRDFMREFYVYGFKVRSEYTKKSPRTYDNERRRIESYLGSYIKSDYSSKGKQVFISVDSREVPVNPLYAAWKSKSFTDNDLMLHFFLLDLLRADQNMTANEIADEISMQYGNFFEAQTVRLKLREYEAEGILESRKEGRAVCYGWKKKLAFEEKPEVFLPAVQYFQGAAPFGFIGSTILDRERAENVFFRFRHHYIVHTLEDGILYQILRAMREKRRIRLKNRGGNMEGVPLKIFVGTQTGRRYVCVYKEAERRFANLRLDFITEAEPAEEYDGYEERREELERNLPRCWGVSFNGTVSNVRIEEIYVKLWIEEKRESFVLERLKREGRGGEVIRISENVFLYSGVFFDTNEMLPWIKTFTGRILDIQGSNLFVVSKLEYDLDKMYQMYQNSPACQRI